MALAKFGLKFRTKDPKINMVFEDIRAALNELIDNANIAPSKDRLVKVGSDGIPDYLSADHFERTQARHIKIKQNYLQHGMLSGLHDDDHTHYALLAGRSGGQVLIGGTATGEDLELQTTAHATKGDFIFRHGTIKLYDTDNSNYLGFITPDISADVTWTLPLVDGSANDFLQTNGTGTLIFAAAPGATHHFFKTITGITNDVVADAIDDALTLASANNRLTIVGTTATDTITWTLVEANIDHDALTNFAAGEHFTEASINHLAITNLSYATAGHTGFEPTVTKGNLTETTSSVLSITGGTGAIIGSGTTIQVTLAATGTDGYLSGADWDTFNGKSTLALGETQTTAYRGDRGKLAYDHIHNLTSDIDHDLLNNFAANEHFLQSAITTVGTIASGTWQGTSIGVTWTDAKCTDATADNTAGNETSHTDVVQDGDFASNGLMKRTGAGAYGIQADNSTNWDAAHGWGDHSGANSDITSMSGITGTIATPTNLSTKTTGAWSKSIGSGGDYADWATMLAAMPDLIAHAVTVTIEAGTTLAEVCNIKNKHGITSAGTITVQAEKYFPTSGAIPTADSATAITLRDAALATAALGDDYFNGCWVFIVHGTGTDNGFVPITDYVDATGDIVVGSWTTQPDNTSRYLIVGALIDGNSNARHCIDTRNNTCSIYLKGIGLNEGLASLISYYNSRIQQNYCGHYKGSIGINCSEGLTFRMVRCGIVNNHLSDSDSYGGLAVSSQSHSYIIYCGISDNLRRGILVQQNTYNLSLANFGDNNGTWGIYARYSGQARCTGTECSGSGGNHGNRAGDGSLAY